MFSLAGNFSLLIVLCLYGLYVSLLNGCQHSSLSSSSRLQLQGFTQTAVPIDRQVLNGNTSSYSFLVLFMFSMFFPPCSGSQLPRIFSNRAAHRSPSPKNTCGINYMQCKYVVAGVAGGLVRRRKVR